MSLKILLVDDNAPLRDCLDLWLTEERAHVTAVNDGQEAIEELCADTIAFNVVISDVDMPRINGWRLLAWVREHNVRLPVVLISGDQPSQFIHTAQQAGAYGALSKPFELNRLRSLLVDLRVLRDRPI